MALISFFFFFFFGCVCVYARMCVSEFMCVCALCLTIKTQEIGVSGKTLAVQARAGVGPEAYSTYFALPETCTAKMNKKTNWVMAC